MTCSTRAVVPAAIEEDQLLGRRQVGHITLKIPGSAVPLRGRPERDDTRFAWAQVFQYAFDRPILAARVTTLAQDEEALALADQVPLQLDEFDL